ncbi:MAG: hypothetical protein V4580_04425 [Bacteroidota bacterium]
MQKTILIPTDFTIESLVTVKQAISQNPDTKLNIVLLYSCFITDSITDLLFYSPDKIINEHCHQNFHDAISIIRNRFSEKIEDMTIEVFHGYSVLSLENFAKKNEIDHIYISKNYAIKEVKNQFDIAPFVKKSNFPYTELAQLDNNFSFSQTDNLINLFNTL